MRKPWYKDALEKYGNKALLSAVVSIVVTSLFSLWYFGLGRSFVWHPISPIPQPGFLDGELYGVVAYFTIGAFLFYVLRFWQLLYFICVTTLKDKKLYRDVKWVVRGILALITQFYIVPTVIDWANAIVSFFYNAWLWLLYVSPSLGVLLLVFGIVLSAQIVFKKEGLKLP